MKVVGGAVSTSSMSALVFGSLRPVSTVMALTDKRRAPGMLPASQSLNCRESSRIVFASGCVRRVARSSTEISHASGGASSQTRGVGVRITMSCRRRPPEFDRPFDAPPLKRPQTYTTHPLAPSPTPANILSAVSYTTHPLAPSPTPSNIEQCSFIHDPSSRHPSPPRPLITPLRSAAPEGARVLVAAVLLQDRPPLRVADERGRVLERLPQPLARPCGACAAPRRSAYGARTSFRAGAAGFAVRVDARAALTDGHVARHVDPVADVAQRRVRARRRRHGPSAREPREHAPQRLVNGRGVRVRIDSRQPVAVAQHTVHGLRGRARRLGYARVRHVQKRPAVDGSRRRALPRAAVSMAATQLRRKVVSVRVKV
eukprot:1472138-Prymnesium_polylepis.2